MKDYVYHELDHFRSIMTATNATIHYSVDIGIGNKSIVIKPNKERATLHTNLNSFDVHIVAITWVVKCIKEVIAFVVNFYFQHQHDKIKVVERTMDHLQTISKKSDISFEDWDKFRAMMEGLLIVVKDSPQTLINNESATHCEATNTNIMIEETILATIAEPDSIVSQPSAITMICTKTVCTCCNHDNM